MTETTATPPLDAQKLHAMSQHINKHGDGPTRDNWAILRDAYAELAGLNKPAAVSSSCSVAGFEPSQPSAFTGCPPEQPTETAPTHSKHNRK